MQIKLIFNYAFVPWSRMVPYLILTSGNKTSNKEICLKKILFNNRCNAAVCLELRAPVITELGHKTEQFVWDSPNTHPSKSSVDSYITQCKGKGENVFHLKDLAWMTCKCSRREFAAFTTAHGTLWELLLISYSMVLCLPLQTQKFSVNFFLLMIWVEMTASYNFSKHKLIKKLSHFPDILNCLLVPQTNETPDQFLAASTIYFRWI